MVIRNLTSRLVQHARNVHDLPPSSSSKLARSPSSGFPAPLLPLHLPRVQPRARFFSQPSAWAEESGSSVGEGSGLPWTGWELSERGKEEGRKRRSTLDGRTRLRPFPPHPDTRSSSTVYEDGPDDDELLSSWPNPPKHDPTTLRPPPSPPPPPLLSPSPPLRPPIFLNPTPQSERAPLPLRPASLFLPSDTPCSFFPSRPSLELTPPPPSVHPAPDVHVLSLVSHPTTLASSPKIPLEGLDVSPAEFSSVLKLLESQSVSSTREDEGGSDVTGELARNRKSCARLLLRVDGEREVGLSEEDERCMVRAQLQLLSANNSSSSYTISDDGFIFLRLPFFQQLLSPSSSRTDALTAAHQLSRLLPRIPFLVENRSPTPRRDVSDVFDLLLERCAALVDPIPVDLVLTSLARRLVEGRDDAGVSFLLRRILHAFDGSSACTSQQSIELYERIEELVASPYLGSAAICQFGLSLSDLWAAGRVLKNPQLSSRHFHLLAYRLVLAIEKSLVRSPSGRRYEDVGRLKTAFRRMLGPGRRPLSVDLRNRVVDLLTRNGQRTAAAWIYLNHPTIPIASASIIIDLDASSSPLPPSPVESAPLPLPLAEELLLVLCQHKRSHDLLLAFAVLRTIPQRDQSIKFYNLLLCHSYATLVSVPDEADAFASSILAYLATNPFVRPNIETLEAHLQAPPKTKLHIPSISSWEERAEVESFRRSASEAYFTLAMERGAEFRRRTWECLVGAVTAECGFERGREVVEWMRAAGFEPDEETTWGEQLLGKIQGRGTDAGERVEEVVEELMTVEGVRNGRHIYTSLLSHLMYSPAALSRVPRAHFRTLFLTDFVARGFPGTSWIKLVPPTPPLDSKTPPSHLPTISLHRTFLPARIHLTASLPLSNPHRSFFAAPPAPPNMLDLQPPAHWSDWLPPLDAVNGEKGLGRRAFSFERDVAPLLAMLMGWFRREGDEEFEGVLRRCLQEGRTEEKERDAEGIGGRGGRSGGRGPGGK